MPNNVEPSGREAETYWQRRIVMLEHVVMQVVEKTITKHPSLGNDLGKLMMEWDNSIGQLDVEFMMKDFDNKI